MLSITSKLPLKRKQSSSVYMKYTPIAVRCTSLYTKQLRSPLVISFHKPEGSNHSMYGSHLPVIVLDNSITLPARITLLVGLSPGFNLFRLALILSKASSSTNGILFTSNMMSPPMSTSVPSTETRKVPACIPWRHDGDPSATRWTRKPAACGRFRAFANGPSIKTPSKPDQNEFRSSNKRCALLDVAANPTPSHPPDRLQILLTMRLPLRPG